jgi:hypothetical protein
MQNERPRFRKALILGLGAFVPGLLAGWLIEPPVDANIRGGEPGTRQTLPDPIVHSAELARTSPNQSEFVTRLHEALSIGNRIQRDKAMVAIADGMNVAEIRDALTRLESIHVRERAGIRKALLARWGELDPKGAIGFAMEVTNAAERTEAVNAVLAGWIEKDANEVEAWVAQLKPSALRTAALTALVEAFGITNPRHALELAQKIPGETLYGLSSDGVIPVIHAVFDKWIDDDPAGAAEAAAKLTGDPGFREMAMHLIGKRWAERDLQRALSWAQSVGFNLESSINRSGPLTGIAETWLAKDPDAAIAWLNDIPDSAGKVGLFEILAFNLASNNPAEAVRVGMAIPAGSLRDHSIDYPISSWIRSDPKAAADWALHYEDNDARRVALRSVAADWIRDDPANARAWIQSLPNYATKDTMLRDAVNVIAKGVDYGDVSTAPLIGSMSSKAIQTAAEVLSEIGDTTQRKAAYLTLSGRWLSVDPNSARAWIDTLSISPQEKEELLKAKAKPWPPR